jgi:hypothetical protein
MTSDKDAGRTEQMTDKTVWVAGADAVAAVEQKARDLLAQVDAYRDISTSLAIA